MKTKKTILVLSLLCTILSTAFVSGYTAEEIAAYEYSYKNNITTQPTIETADMEWWLTRVAMAKMLSNYAINILGLTPDINKICIFPDVPSSLDTQYDDWVTKACQLGLMGVGINLFYPYWKVTRAEFGTVLSRALNWKDSVTINNLNNSDPYYKKHLEYLRNEWIMLHTSTPDNFEIRWRVMIMLMRAGGTGCSSDEFNWILNKCNIDNTWWYPCYEDWENSLYCRHVVSITSDAFENHKNLKKLTILWWWSSVNNTLGSLKWISVLKDLEELDLPHNNLNDLSPISSMTNLVRLNLDSNYISDISPLKNLKNLKELSLNLNYVSDISVLKYLTWLTVLNIQQSYWNKKISDIEVLRDFHDLKTLDLSAQNISDISAIRNNTQLEILHLSRNNISEISPLMALTNLKELALWQNKISDITVLSNMKKLEFLGLDTNKISDIYPLNWLTKLVNLALNTNNIRNVAPLSWLNNLKYLYLGENNISDISPLENLGKLLQLYIWKNPINYSEYPWLKNIPEVSTEY